MEKYFELVVIGGGPAGITLAKKLGKIFHMAVIRPEPHSMIYCAMPYAVEGIIQKEKTYKKDSLVTDAEAELVIDAVESVDEKAKKLKLVSGGLIYYEKLIIASGAESYIPDIPGNGLKGIYTFKTQADLEKLIAVKSGIKKAVVVGAGAIGIELAQALVSIGVETHLVEMAGSILPNMADEEMTEDAKIKLFASGMALHLGAKIKEITGWASVESVVLDNETEINLKNDEKVCAGGGIPGEIGIVIFTAGVKPSLKFIEGTTIKYTCGGISVNEHMETNVSGVYACGDCAEFKSAITGNVYPGKLATNAVPMAKVLADNLKGYKRKYEGFFNGAATKILDVYLGSAGLSEKEALRLGYEAVAGYSDVTTKFPVMPGVLKLRTKLVADRKTGFLLGGQVVSGEPVAARVDVITMALQNRATVEGLMNHSYSAQPYQSSYPAENCLVAAAEQLHEKIRA